MDKRKFCASFSVKIAQGGLRPPSTPQSAAEQSPAASYSTSRIRFELSPAPLHGGPEGGYRVRVQRRWLNGKDGSPRFFDRTLLAAMLADVVLGTFGDLPPAPDIPAKARVSVRLNRDGKEYYEGTWTTTPPILTFDGRWMVAVLLYGKGTVFVPCDDVILHTGGKHERR